MSPGTSLVAGSAIDMQILRDLFTGVAEASAALGLDPDLRARLLEARAKLAPMQVGRRGELQEWLDDWDQREASHRHIWHLYGVYPGAQIGPRATPDRPRPAAGLTSGGSSGTGGRRRGRRPRGRGSGTVTGRWKT